MTIQAAWSDVIRSNWASLVLFIDLRTGSYQDLSSYARAVTLTNAARPPQWPSQTQGKGLDVGGTAASQGYLSVAHAAELNLNPSGTIACFVRDEFGMATNAIYTYKRTAGVSCAYQLYERNSAGSLGLFDGTTGHILGAYSIPLMRSVAAAFTNGNVPIGYVNGVRLSPPATLWSPLGAEAAALYLANSVGATNGTPGAGWHCFLLFSSQLTGAEISQLHSDFVASPYVL
jgi:hypothetical protein